MSRRSSVRAAAAGAVVCALGAVICDALPLELSAGAAFGGTPVGAAASAIPVGPRCPQGQTVTINTAAGDAGAAVNAADAAFGSTAGIIRVVGGGTVSTQIKLHQCHTLEFGPGTWVQNTGTSASCVAAETGCEMIVFYDHTAIRGAGAARTILREEADVGADRDKLTAFVIRDHGSAVGGGGDTGTTDVTLRDLQISGVGVGRAANGAQSTVFLGFAQNSSVEGVELNGTHSIGLTIGDTCPGVSCPPSYRASNVLIANSSFLNVGGCGSPPVCRGGGGVTLAIIQGDHVTIRNNLFQDALGNATIDVEPNAPRDAATNITITHNRVDQSGKSGRFEQGIYAIVLHGYAVQNLDISDNTIVGGWYQNVPYQQYLPGGHILQGINTNYACAGCSPSHIAIDSNIIKYVGGCGICLFADHSTVTNNLLVMTQGNMLVIGTNDLVASNTILGANDTEGPLYYFGIEEQGGDYNQFIGNKTVGVCFLGDRSTYVCGGRPPTEPVHIVGRHSRGRGNVLVPRPPWAALR